MLERASEQSGGEQDDEAQPAEGALSLDDAEGTLAQSSLIESVYSQLHPPRRPLAHLYCNLPPSLALLLLVLVHRHRYVLDEERPLYR